MITKNEFGIKNDMKGLFSTLWIFLAVNYIYCDHLSNMEPGVIKGLMAGQIGSIQITQVFLLSAAIILEIPFIMIVLSRVLRYRANRWVNIIAGIIMVAIQIGTMGMGNAPTLVYIFYSVIEIACALVIVWFAWKWQCPNERFNPQLSD